MPKVINELTYAELFAGCGGLSLGLEAAGFHRVFANELSPIAAQTYVHNLYCNPSDKEDEVFVRICDRKKRNDDPSKWEDDPRKYFDDPVSTAFSNHLQDMHGTMFVGGVDQFISGLIKAKREGKLDRDALELDVLAGGPPCQSFSRAGRRELDNPRNRLPFSFVRCAELLRPKIVLLENVSGILHPFHRADGKISHAWLDIAKRFFDSDPCYIPICTHSSALNYGVPQNRPRFIMICLRSDIAQNCIAKLSGKAKWKAVLDLIEHARINLGKKSIESDLHTAPSAFRWVDASTQQDKWPSALLAICTETPSVEEAIDDLSRIEPDCFHRLSSGYPADLSRKLPVPASGSRKDKTVGISNHEQRTHCPRVRARFRILRLLAASSDTRVESNDLNRLTRAQKQLLMSHRLIFLDTNEIRKPRSESELENLLAQLSSQKHSQRALKKGQPAPAQLTIPDDLVHYAEDRTLTVREMARIQSFPDDFEFVGKVTTGGDMRKYEVPQYTQVGNAVPPLLARTVGEGLARLLNKLKEINDLTRD